MALLSKKAMNFTYGMGAAVVIIGALFKIQHYPGASELLIVGLCTEAFIFALSAFEPVDQELDWSLVYPELAGGEATAGGAAWLRRQVDPGGGRTVCSRSCVMRRRPTRSAAISRISSIT